MKAILNLLSKQKHTLLPIVFVAVFIAVVIITAPLKQTFEYNPDEGSSIMGSLLYLKGFSLYNEIYSDQPPLSTVILSFWLKLFGLSIYHARILTLIFSGILLLAFYQTIKNLWGDFCAIIATIFLILSTAYLPLSISVMIGIPSLAFAMLSIYCVTLYRKIHLKHLLVLSGIFMALSLQTKLFTVFLVPIIISEITQVKKIRLSSALILWIAAFLTIYLSITIIFFHFNWRMFNQQLFRPHLKQLIVPNNNFSLMLRMILDDYDTVLLSLLGIVLLIRQKKWQFLFPILWLVSAFAILFKHNPVWHHYYPLISIPMCWLAAISFKVPRKSFFYWLTLGLIILVIFRLPLKSQRIYTSVESGAIAQKRKLLELLSQYKNNTHWIVTDRPIFAFYAHMLVPPELVLTCQKRNFTGKASQEYFINKLQKYKPEQILLGKYQYYSREIISYIEKNYFKIYNCAISKQVWVPKNVFWLTKRTRFMNHTWSYKLPLVVGGFARQAFDGEIMLYIRKDIVIPSLSKVK